MSNKTKKTSIGGQALIEGIMMKGPDTTAMAVRNASGQIVLEKWETSKKTPVIAKIPILRGIYGMVSSLTTGYKCLMRSADIAMEDILAEEEEEKVTAENADAPVTDEATENTETEIAENTETEVAMQNTVEVSEATSRNVQSEIVAPTPKKTKAEKSEKEKKDSAMVGVVTVISMVLAVFLSVGLFILLPTVIAAFFVGGTAEIFGWRIFSTNGLFPMTGSAQIVVKSVIEGVLKIVVLVGYMWAVSFMKEIRTTFMYHGAEHKTIFCYEQGLELTVENVREQRRFHPRCGTSFMILMLLVSIFIGFFIPFQNTLIRFAVKLLLLPLTVGIGYELIKFAGRHDNVLTRIISAPGVALQHITTKEPNDRMIECAIAAMNEVIPKDSEKDNW